MSTFKKEDYALSDDGKFYILKEEIAKPYREALNIQMNEWVDGKSIHNKEYDECCPDFSCCEPKLLWPEEKRKAFSLANEEEREKMLLGQVESLLDIVTNPPTIQ